MINKKGINDYARNHRTAGVDLLPTISDFMGVDIDQKSRYHS
ncbi:MAG: hypothetical protein PHQ67_07365 [Fermentimonas sp.]|nr:hypothetical protein [Fermentimonas sp.]